MSFSSDIKQEISKKNNLAKKEELKYELIGYLISSNCIVVNKNKKEIKFSTESDYNINRFSKILSNLYIKHNIYVTGNLFVINAKLENIEFVDIKQKNVEIVNVDSLYNSKEENKKAIIRGVFLGAGSINNPNNKYHFEINLSNKNNLEFVVSLIEGFKIKVKKLDNKIYIKEGEEISKILALMGANKAIMKFEDIRIEREMRGKINRIVNCETANLNKTINASIEQIEAIEKLKKEKKFNLLNENLQEIAKLRLENPNMSLENLGKLLNKPIGKSGVNYRLKKIVEIANG